MTDNFKDIVNLRAAVAYAAAHPPLIQARYSDGRFIRPGHLVLCDGQWRTVRGSADVAGETRVFLDNGRFILPSEAVRHP